MMKRDVELMLAGSLLYLLSDVLAKKYLSDVSLALIISSRYAIGLVLLPYLTVAALVSWRSHFFSTVNIANSAAGVAALIFGTMQGFALASQFRPVFMAAILAWMGMKASPGATVRIVLAFAVSLLIAIDGSIFSVWTLIFLVTILFQCITFVIAGKASDISPLAFAALYNLVGAILSFVVLFVVDWVMPTPTQALVLIVSSALSVIGSVAMILALSRPSSFSSAIGLYVRLPLSMLAGLLLFDETPTVFAAAMAVLLFAILIADTWSTRKSSA